MYLRRLLGTICDHRSRVRGPQSVRSNMNEWYAIKTKAWQEELAEANLRMIGLDTFNPRLKQKACLFGSRVAVVRPLFPSYIFAKFDVALSQRHVRYTIGVQHIIGFGEGPTPVGEDIIALIKQRIGPDGCVKLEKQLRQGEAIEIVNGPLAGLVGMMEEEISSSERVVVLLSAISYQARALIDIEDVQRVGYSNQKGRAA